MATNTDTAEQRWQDVITAAAEAKQQLERAHQRAVQQLADSLDEPAARERVVAIARAIVKAERERERALRAQAQARAAAAQGHPVDDTDERIASATAAIAGLVELAQG